jgi:2-polyprenyl-6-methoxyphenol hydroxylase-like FAD-dependent oxidoreductase
MTMVAVAGGGIGGLATAIALEPTDIEPVVFEKAADLKKVEVGAGITLWPNAVKMLDRLGVGEEVRNHGSLFSGCLQQRTASGRLLAEWDLREMGHELGAPAMGIRRPALHEVLASAAAAHVTPGSQVTSFEESDSGVTVSLADGRMQEADALIGADGIDSVIRASLFGAKPPRYSGLTIWRAVAEFDDSALPPGALLSYWGSGTRFVIFRVAPGTMVWEATLATEAGGKDPESGVKPSLLQHFADFVDPVKPMIEAADDRSIIRDDVCDRPPAESWGRGRITLLGDAAHAMTFAVGQGAAQAFEDAVALADSLQRASAVQDGLRAYEQRRMKRAAHFQTTAWRLARIGVHRDPIRCGLRNLFFRASSGIGRRMQVKDLQVPVADPS